MSWKVRPLGKNCAASGERLQAGTNCYSVLIMEEGEFARRDYSEAAWTGPPDPHVGWWRCRVPEKQLTLRPLDPDELMLTLQQLVDEASPSSEQLRYVLTLQLLQKKRVEIESVREEDENRFLTIIGTNSEGPFEVLDLGLEDEAIQVILDEFRGADIGDEAESDDD